MSDALVINESDVEQEAWSDAQRGEVFFRTILGTHARTPEFTAGVAELGPGGWLAQHRHEPAEMYYVTAGEGILTVDGEEHVIRAGTTAYVPGNSEHGVRNTGDGPLRVFYTFAIGSFDQVEYRFSA